MPEYEFEIQSLVKVKIEAENKIVARMEIIDYLDRYVDDDPYVSDGEEGNRGERNV